MIGVGRRHKVVQELLLQRKELIEGEFLLLIVVTRDNIFGLCLVAGKTWCKMGGEARGLSVLKDSRLASYECHSTDNDSNELHLCYFFLECDERFAIAIETVEALGLIVDEEEW